MNNFSEYLNLNQSIINNIFNTVTKEGQELIYFNDIIEIIQFFEENKEKEENNTSISSGSNKGLSLNVFEMKIILDNFEQIMLVNSVQELMDVLDGCSLMFIVEYESKHGKNSAPDIFVDANLDLLYSNIMNDPIQLKNSMNKKLLSKTEEDSQNSHQNSLHVFNLNNVNSTSNSINKGHPPSRASFNVKSMGEHYIFI